MELLLDIILDFRFLLVVVLAITCLFIGFIYYEHKEYNLACSFKLASVAMPAIYFLLILLF